MRVYVRIAGVVLLGSTVLRGQQPSAAVSAKPLAIASEGSSASSPDAEWKRASDARAAELTARFGAGRNPELRAKLLALQAQDQQARGLAPDAEGKMRLAKDVRDVDRALSAQLRALVEVSGWPNVALVGLEASNAAMLVLGHSPDHAWQRALLPILEEQADAGKIDAAPLAAVVDKELVSEGKLQRYGTQFRLVHGAMAMCAVEDPAGLDRRRERLLLPPMAVYKNMLSAMYRLPVGTAIAQAGPARE